jgi:pre-peptidase
MKTNLIRTLSLVAVLLAAASALIIAPGVKAGGPLIVLNGQPTRWPRTLTQGGPLNSQTVDAQGRVLYRVDSGPLGPLSNTEAVAIVDRIFNQYSSIPTSTIKFVNAGPIRDPNTGQPVDVTSANFGKFTSDTTPTFQNPIVFDSDGQITGRGGVLGFFGALQLDEINNLHVEGFVVLNGASVNLVGKIPFTGVFTHEFGHFAGPLDHAQINGNIAELSASSTPPAGFTSGQLYDLYAPFTETVFPFLFNSPGGAQLGGQAGNSGFFIASLDLDTRNALSDLYPAPGYRASDPGSPNGAIEGHVVVRTSSGDVPISGINVIARRINLGAYPPVAGTQAYPNNQVTLDGDGIPQRPPAQNATDSLATARSDVSGNESPPGVYHLEGLPPGNYMVEVQQINPNALSGSGIGPLSAQFPLIVPEQIADMSPVTVTAGVVTTGVDIVLSGFSTAPLSQANEREPNEKKGKAQHIDVQSEVFGQVSEADAGKIKINLGGGDQSKLQDLYRFDVTSDRTVIITIDPINGSTGDLDLYLLDDSFTGKKIGIDDASVRGVSNSPSASELIGVRLSPGTYYIGVSAFAGSLNYRLRVIQSQ